MIRSFSRVLPLVEYGVSALITPGQVGSGDLHLVRTFPGGTILAAVNGARNGPEAATRARLAISILDAHASGSMASLVRQCNQRLKGAQGVVVSLAIINGVEDTLTWLGIGGIEGILVRCAGSPHPAAETLLLSPGAVEDKLSAPQPVVTPIAPGDLVVLTTRAIRADFIRQFAFEDQPRKIAEYISSSFRNGLDDGLVLVARYLGRSHEQNGDSGRPSGRY